ncbi:hypothetical protein ACQ4PT_045926 [Festuca glaucescens]
MVYQDFFLQPKHVPQHHLWEQWDTHHLNSSTNKKSHLSMSAFSLGVVIIHMIAGRKHYYDHVDTPSKIIELVCENWRKRLHATMWAHASQEIKTCIEIALRCVKSDRQERPTISKIVDDLNMIDIAKLPLTCKGDIMQKPEMVGAFQRIPVVTPATDILTSAQRESRNVPPTKVVV